MRKTLVFLLTIALLIPSMASFAATGAENLYDYGFIAGADGDLMVDKSLTRAEATVLLSEMYGKKEEAENFIFVPTFTDVKAGDWYAPYIGYARVAGWVSGYEDNSFKPKNPISQREWAAMLMKVMGYEFPWVDVLDEMEDVGIEVEATIPGAILRGEAFEAMWQAVNLPRKDADMPLGEEIGRFEPSVPEPEEPEELPFLVIEEVTSDHLMGMTLHFNREVDKEEAENLETYELEDEDGRDIALDRAVYDAREMTVVLTFEEAVDQQEEVTLIIEELSAVEGIPLEDFEETYTVSDRTFPSVLSARVIGSEAIEVRFSEPVMPHDIDEDDVATLDKDAIDVDEGDIYVREIVLLDGNRRAVIETYTSIRDDVMVDPKPTIEDYAGLSLVSDPIEAAYERDDDAPEIIAVEEVSPVGLTLVWSETIRLENGNKSHYYHSNTNTLIDSNLTASDIDGERMRLSFANDPLPEGRVRVYVDNDSVSDYWGNENDDESITVEIEEDNTDPSVEEIEVLDENEIMITFSEPMNNGNYAMENRNNYVLFDESHDEIDDAVLRADYDASEYTVTITFYDQLNGLYSLLMEDLEDASGNGLDDDEHFFEVADLTSPESDKWTAKAYFVGDEDQMLRITFDEPMATDGKYSVLDLEKYQVNGIDLVDLDDVAIKSVEDGKAIEIYIDPEELEIDVDSDDEAEDDDDVVIARVADEAGNYTASFVNVIDLQGEGTFRIDYAQLIREDQVRVTFTEEIVGLEPDDVRVYEDDDPLALDDVLSGLNDDGVTEIIYVLRNPVPTDATDLTVQVVDNESVNRYDETLDLDQAPVLVEDKVGPTLARVTIDGDEEDDIIYDEDRARVELTFTEDIDPRTVSLLSFEVMNYEISDIGVSGTRIYIYIDADDEDRVERYDEVIQMHEIRDMNGNGVTGISGRIQEIE